MILLCINWMISTSNTICDWNNFIFKRDGLFCFSLAFLFSFLHYQFCVIPLSHKRTMSILPCPLLSAPQTGHSDYVHLLILFTVHLAMFNSCSLLIFTHNQVRKWSLHSILYKDSAKVYCSRQTCIDISSIQTYRIFHTPSDFAIRMNGCKSLSKECH